MRVILDSNVLLVAIGRKSRYHPIWNAFVAGAFEIGLSQDILSEYEEVLTSMVRLARSIWSRVFSKNLPM